MKLKALLLAAGLLSIALPDAASASCIGCTITILSWTDRTNPFVDQPGLPLATFNTLVPTPSNQWVQENGTGQNLNVTFTGHDGTGAQSGLFAGNLPALNPTLEASPYGNANSNRLYLAAGGGGGYVDMHYNGGALTSLGMLWGTVDFDDASRNQIRFETGQTLSGLDVLAACGLTAGCSLTNGQTNVLLVISGLQSFDDARFSDAGANSFEYNVRALNAAVPEASTWAMMFLGFAGIGLYGMRRRRKDEQPLLRLA